MTERRKDFLTLGLLLLVLIVVFNSILFTGKIIRAPDIINEYYWTVKDIPGMKFLDLFRINISNAGWDPYHNSGYTTEGGGIATQFLIYHRLIYWLIPAPASVAWFIVLHLFFGAAGIYCFCRMIGASRVASFAGGLIFAVAPEHASLINAGHVLKIATISFAPWAFYFYERGMRTRRLIFFMTTAMVLTFQFFNTHWQIAFYTCLGVGVYGLMRSVGIIVSERHGGVKGFSKILGLNLLLVLFFLTTVAISLAPLAHWSLDTNRGVESGANQGKGGLDREEAMSWSLPPEELGAFIIPGFFGLSRQEGGENPTNISSYYWGRMNFTQTTDYMGLLPWLLLPLPLVFRRDRYTWLALTAVAMGIIFSMGKFTVFYNLLYDYFPGINRFRVPKMIMFLPVMGLGVLTAQGLDLLLDDEIRRSAGFKRYLYGLLALPLLLLLLLGVEVAGKELWTGAFFENLAQPTRYEEGMPLVIQRWNNLVAETGIAAGIAALYAAVIFGYYRKWLSVKLIPLILLALYLADVGRVNAKFEFLVDVPGKAKSVKTPAMEFILSHGGEHSRVIPMDGADPREYSSFRIPVMFTSFPVQQVRWQNILDSFSLLSPVPDILNVRYLVYDTAQYRQEKAQLDAKYQQVFQSTDGKQVVVENRTVMPKAWLVPAVALVTDVRQTMGILLNPSFNPRAVAIVESPPPFPMANPETSVAFSQQTASVTTYEGDRIQVKVQAPQNALLVLGEKYYKGWKATVDGIPEEIHPADYILRGVYLKPGDHTVEFIFDPLPYKIGKWLTLTSFVIFALFLGWEVKRRRLGAGN